MAWVLPAERGCARLIVLQCPHCAGLHRHGYQPGDRRVHRTAHCSPPFRTTDSDEGYVVEVQDEPAPDWIVEALDRPLGDLGAALIAIRDPRRRIIPHRGLRLPNAIAIPATAPVDVRFALKALSRCGALDEARAIRIEMGEQGLLEAQRGATAELWAGSEGRTMRERLANAILRCWQSGGGC